MKLKLAFLLALISSAGLIAADAPKPDAPKGDEPGKKAEKGKGDKGGKKQAPQKPESVDEATWKKFQEAMKAAQGDEAAVGVPRLAVAQGRAVLGHDATTGKPLNIRGWEEWELNDDLKVVASRGWFDAKDYARQAAG